MGYMKRVSKKIIELSSNEGTCSFGEQNNACNTHDDCKSGFHCKFDENLCKVNEYTCEDGTKKDGNPKLDSQGKQIRSNLRWCTSCVSGFKRVDKDGKKTTSSNLGDKCVPTKWTCVDE